MDVLTSLQPPPRRCLRILYAEDVRELRDLARVVFTRDGHKIDCAVDGAEALERVMQDQSTYDLLITDHHMPRMSGIDLVTELRRLEFKGRIMVFSSELNPVVSDEYRKLAVDRILFKPVYPSFLKQTIAELFPEEVPV